MTLFSVPILNNGDILNQTTIDTIATDINELIGLRTRNLLVNGGFEVWQRGNGPFNAAGVYTADRWYVQASGGQTVSVARETTTVDGSSGSALYLTASASDVLVRQRLEDVTQLRGRTLSFSIRVQQSVANLIGVMVASDVNAYSLPTGTTNATTGSYVTISYTFAVPSNATAIDFGIRTTGAGNAYIDNAMVVVGPVPVDYVPLHPQEEMARCQRYYEIQGIGTGELGQYGYQAASAIMGPWVPFAVPKGGVPTVTKNGTWGVVNCGQPAVSNVSSRGFALTATATATGSVQFYVNSSDDTITAEWNP